MLVIELSYSNYYLENMFYLLLSLLDVYEQIIV